MRLIMLAGLLLLALPRPGHAQRIPPSAGASPGLQCRSAIAAAERGTHIPPHLLAAIGRVESGRPDAVTGQVLPWPWTINAEGQGMMFDTRQQAIDAVRRLQAQGVRSIDVGCMQVNLMHHPQAFTSLEEAFDPVANARYAARFLTELFSRTGAWAVAAAYYHSATPGLADDYARRVLALWPEEARSGVTVRSAMAYGWTTRVILRDGLVAPSRAGERRANGRHDGGLLRPSARVATRD